MPRPKVYDRKLLLRLTDDDWNRLQAAIGDGETATSIIRDAMLRELARRERQPKRRRA